MKRAVLPINVIQKNKNPIEKKQYDEEDEDDKDEEKEQSLDDFLSEIAKNLDVEDVATEINSWKAALGKYCRTVDNLKWLVSDKDIWNHCVKLDPSVAKAIQDSFVPSINENIFTVESAKEYLLNFTHKQRKEIFTYFGNSLHANEDRFREWYTQKRTVPWDCEQELCKPEDANNFWKKLPIETINGKEEEVMMKKVVQGFYESAAYGCKLHFQWDTKQEREANKSYIDLLIYKNGTKIKTPCTSCCAIEFKTMGELKRSQKQTDGYHFRREARRGLGQLIQHAQIIMDKVQCPFQLYCLLTDFEQVVFLKFVADTNQERAFPRMFISSTYSFYDSKTKTDPPLAFILLQGLFMKLKILKASVEPKLSGYFFDKPLEMISDNNEMSILVVGYAMSTSHAHIYSAYLFSPFCSVAVKISKPGQDLLNEYLVLKHLGCITGVQRLQLWSTLNGRPILVTSPFGVPLSTLVLQHAFSSAEATIIIFELLDILSRVHAKGVIHRDIKPSNVIVYDKNLYLIDFGVACFKAEKNTSWAGTALYSALPAMLGFPADPSHDYESLVYLAIYLVRQHLPWSQIYEQEHIIECKKYYRQHLEKLCDGFPFAFIEFAHLTFKHHHTRQTEHKILSCRSSNADIDWIQKYIV